jgi:signal transduction histidine kinase
MTVGFVVAMLASSINAKKRAIAHDTCNALLPLMAQLERIQHGMSDDVAKAKQLVMAIRAAYHPEGEESIRLAQYLRLLLSSLADMTELYVSANPAVLVELGDLHRILVNVLRNAAEAREAAKSDRPIRVHLTETSIAVGNPSTEADRIQVQKPSGSTRGPGRGSGRRSIQDSCDRIGWGVQWQVAGTRVVTTLSFG